VTDLEGKGTVFKEMSFMYSLRVLFLPVSGALTEVYSIENL